MALAFFERLVRLHERMVLGTAYPVRRNWEINCRTRWLRPPSNYMRAAVLDGTTRILNLQNLGLQIRMLTGTRNEKGRMEYKTTGLMSDIDIRDGQKVVVAKSDVKNGESPLILVVTAKVE